MAKPRKRKSLLRIWSNRLGALLIWAYAAYALSPLFDRFPPPQPVLAAYGQSFRWARYLLYLAVFILIVRYYGKRSLLYIISFPVWAPLVFGWNVLRLLGLTVGLFLRIFGVNAKLLNRARSTRAAIACYLFMPICYFAIHDSESKHVVYAAVVLLVMLSIRIIYGVFCWAMKPLARLCDIMEKINEDFEKKERTEIAEIDQVIACGDIKKLKQRLDAEHNWVRLLDWLEGNFLTPQRILGLFYLVLAFSISLILLNYSVAYWGLNKISPDHFTGSESARGFWDFAYFGLMVMTTSDLSGLLPATSMAKILASSQIVCAVLLLSMLVLAFSTSGHTDVAAATASLKKIMANRRDKYERLKSHWSIEDAVVEDVNDDRSSRGEEKGKIDDDQDDGGEDANSCK